jgi:hypothetical protein
VLYISSLPICSDRIPVRHELTVLMWHLWVTISGDCSRQKSLLKGADCRLYSEIELGLV